MKRTILAILSATALLLASCSSDDSTTESSSPASSTASTSTTAEVADDLEQITLGEPFTWTQCEDNALCDIEVVFTDTTLAETCPGGVSSPDTESMAEPRVQYLTLQGEYHVRANEGQNNFSISETDFTAVTEGDDVADSLIADDCETISPDQQLSNPVEIGLKRQGQLILVIPEDTNEVRYSLVGNPTTYVLDVSDLPVELGAGEIPGGDAAEASAPEPQPAPTTAAGEPAQPAGSIWNAPGDGYNCFGTDAWVDDPSLCTSANLGGDPSYDTMWGPEAAIPATQDPSTIPFSEGGICPAAICGYGTDEYGNPNPTSGEIQTLDGCEQGYITDPELCAAIYERFGY